MRPHVTLLLAASFGLPFIASAQDPTLKLDPKPTVGSKCQLKFEITVKLPEHDAFLSGTAVETVSKVEATRTEATVDWSNFKLVVGDSEEPVPFEPIKLAFNKSGDVEGLSGGIAGSDPRTYLVMLFPMPDKELKKGESTTFTLPAQKDAAIPERKVTESFEGSEDIGGKPANKVKVKVGEVKGEGFTLDGTFWVLNDGTLVKEEASFTNLPIPQANATASGSVKAIAP